MGGRLSLLFQLYMPTAAAHWRWAKGAWVAPAVRLLGSWALPSHTFTYFLATHIAWHTYTYTKHTINVYYCKRATVQAISTVTRLTLLTCRR